MIQLIAVKIPQETSKAGEDEAESHEIEAGANPCRKGSLDSDKVAGSGSEFVGHGEGLNRLLAKPQNQYSTNDEKERRDGEGGLDVEGAPEEAD